MVQIVKAREEHWPQVKKFLIEAEDDDYVIHTWPDWLAHPEKGLILVALVDDIPVGTTYIAFIDQDYCYFQGIRIDLNYRGQGIGQVLSKAGVEWAGKLGFKRAYCGIDQDNYASQHVTAKAGFVKIGEYLALLKRTDGQTEKEPILATGVWQEAGVNDLPVFLEMQKNTVEMSKLGGFLFAYGFYEGRISEALKEETTPWGEEAHFYKYLVNDQAKAFINIFIGDEEGTLEHGYLVQTIVKSDDCDFLALMADFEAYFRRPVFDGYLVWTYQDNPLINELQNMGYLLQAGKGYQIWAQKLN